MPAKVHWQENGDGAPETPKPAGWTLGSGESGTASGTAPGGWSLGLGKFGEKYCWWARRDGDLLAWGRDCGTLEQAKAKAESFIRKELARLNRQSGDRKRDAGLSPS